MAKTIVALATPIGRSGIGVIRLSGGGALSIAQKLEITELKPRFATLIELREPETGDVIDNSIVTFF